MKIMGNATVTLPLADFDTLRAGEQEYKRMASRIAGCFGYSCTKNPDPPECEDCADKGYCDDCEIDKNNPKYTEAITVDVERLIRVTKEYALYGKDIETDLDAIPVERAAEDKAEGGA